MKKIFGEINLTWLKIIIFAILAGIYTAIMAILPITNNTSFKDITVSFEVWILFGIFIIMNSKSAKDSALKCFIFFLISQPIVYLLQIPFSNLGVGIFQYYKVWFIWTILTIPMGFFGYFIKKDKVWGLAILTPILLLLGYHYYSFIRETIYYFPFHLLSMLFCFITLILYPQVLFKNKKAKILGLIISLLIIILATAMAFINKIEYNTIILTNGGELGVNFDDSYNVYLENSKLGEVKIEYNYSFEDYAVNGKFKKGGKTNLILEDSNGNKSIFEINVENNKYNIRKK